MTNWASKTRTVLALGWFNVARVAAYRLSVKLGLNSVRRLQAKVPLGPFFLPVQSKSLIDAPAVSTWQTTALLFSHLHVGLRDAPPEWLANPLTGQQISGPDRNWWEIPDFDPAVGDIKLIWELSRMDWVLAFAQRASKGDAAALKRLNEWLADWCSNNPPYKGPNWKCGQEASIRVMHLSMAAMILGHVDSATPGLCELIRVHLLRIAPTVQYAMAQDNNHGTSEAAALFIGGSWLAALGFHEGACWASTGRRWLENRAALLIGTRGEFSQYSLNYHRVMLDTFCMAEVWRRHMGLPSLSEHWQSKALAATEWLRHIVNPVNGDGPNVGANDGARLLQLTDTPYRDHRPTVQLAMALFDFKRAYAQPGPYDHPLEWLGVVHPTKIAAATKSYDADEGGFAMLRRGVVMVLLRYPRFRFRPSQADVLHLDLWLGADNILRDAGTFSYNTEPKWLSYFGGTASHNTVQFDNREQMPRLSRFLLGDWLKTTWLLPLNEDAQGTYFGAAYRDRRGCCHRRHITLSDSHLHVQDDVTGFSSNAVLRWRLRPGNWHIVRESEKVCLINGLDPKQTLTVDCNKSIVRCELVEGWESRHYLEKTEVSVLEIEVRESCSIFTVLRW